jgi:hypothetical protein
MRENLFAERNNVLEAIFMASESNDKKYFDNIVA